MAQSDAFDLIIIGGGINGAGIARDAAGRGLRVLVCEKGDIACATSSASSKLIHGGLRYLEHYAFRLVAEALSEREILLRSAPHLVHPMRFVLPHGPGLRPAWMIEAGLFLYDRIGGRRAFPGSSRIRLAESDFGAPLKDSYVDGFVYSDCVTDDARLVVETLLGAAELGASVTARTAVVGATPGNSGWEVTLESAGGSRSTVSAKLIVNAAGPWVEQVLHGPLGIASRSRVRLVKGSHVVVPRLYPQTHAYLLQNPDQRVVFLIPFEDDFTLIGTTDVPLADSSGPITACEAETAYLCAAASRFLKQPVAPRDVVWSFAGIRALYDDGSSNPSEVTRDYVLQLERREGAPVLSVFGGKLTTYRRLAEKVLDKIKPLLPPMGAAWTATKPLPGGAELPDAVARELGARYPELPAPWISDMARRYGTRARALVANAQATGLGRHFGAGLYAREIDFLLATEWAASADDVLWRRTKAGLKLSPEAHQAVADYVEGRTRLAGERACAR